MSFTNTRTMIPIASFAKILGIDYFHFFGQYDNVTRPISPSCDDDTYQYDWQSSGKLSRESLAEALRQAEDVVITHLRYAPLPQWYEEEHVLTDYYRAELYSYRNSRGQAKSINTNLGFVTEVGRKVSTFVDSPAIVWIDVDGDGFTETAQLTFATTVTDVDELRVYYPGKSGADEFEIRPLTSAAIAGGIAVVTFPRYLAALQELLEATVGEDPHILIDMTVDANYLDEVDVYRVYSDTTNHGLFFYENDVNCGTTPCELASESVCLTIREPRLGILAYKRADYSSGSWIDGSYAGMPNKIKVYYRAGWQDPFSSSPNKKIDPTLERLIIFYALSILDTEMHGCTNTRNIWQYQTKDLARSSGEERYNLPWNIFDNPLGSTRAAIQLWKHIQPKRLQGFSTAY